MRTVIRFLTGAAAVVMLLVIFAALTLPHIGPKQQMPMAFNAGGPR